mgnify:CR=1 FL=1
MEFEIYQVDAFTNELFAGNPAAIVPLDSWLSDKLMQQIAAENNLSETAFYIEEGLGYHIRWFTPTKEVKLCGHATLATAFVIELKGGFKSKEISFNSKSGILKVEKNNDEFVLDFPKSSVTKTENFSWIKECFGVEAVSVFQCDLDILIVLKNESIIKSVKPDLVKLKSVKTRGVIVTAQGDNTDFVSRFFGPAAGIDEDPVTGSAHTALAPYWGGVLGKKILNAKQVSERGGVLTCEVLENRVKISGKAKLYLKGVIQLN